MRQSYDDYIERHGELQAAALSYWNKTYRNDANPVRRKAAKILVNQAYRTGVCKEYNVDPQGAVDELTNLLGDTNTRIVRLHSNLPIGPNNLLVIK